MIGPSTLLAGVPPVGLGIYARDRIAPGFAFHCIDPRRSNADAMIREAQRRLCGVWLFAGPDAWRPDTWRATLAAFLERATGLDGVGISGIIVDAEMGWSGAPRAEVIALAHAMRAAALRTRIGFTSYPTWPGLALLARELRGTAWASPQIYARTAATDEPHEVAFYFGRWRELFGLRCIPSIAGWEASDAIDTPEEFRAYLASMPRTGGAIVWPVHQTLERRPWMIDALQERYGGLASLGLVPFAAASALDTWSGLALVLLVCVALAMRLAR